MFDGETEEARIHNDIKEVTFISPYTPYNFYYIYFKSKEFRKYVFPSAEQVKDFYIGY